MSTLMDFHSHLEATHSSGDVISSMYWIISPDSSPYAPNTMHQILSSSTHSTSTTTITIMSCTVGNFITLTLRASCDEDFDLSCYDCECESD
jgi:hypothetical protein